MKAGVHTRPALFQPDADEYYGQPRTPRNNTERNNFIDNFSVSFRGFRGYSEIPASSLTCQSPFFNLKEYLVTRPDQTTQPALLQYVVVHLPDGARFLQLQCLFQEVPGLRA